jgi:hypothetical protein
MHEEAQIALPQLLDLLAIERPILIGHSDGGSIALIHAGTRDRAVHAVVTLATHVFVEDISVASIAAAKAAYETTDLRDRLARYHADVDSAFWGWNRIWLAPEFRDWNIEEYLPRIECPVLAIQGVDDEYGTIEQMRRIGAGVGDVELLTLERCRHSPHRDRPEETCGRRRSSSCDEARRPLFELRGGPGARVVPTAARGPRGGAGARPSAVSRDGRSPRPPPVEMVPQVHGLRPLERPTCRGHREGAGGRRDVPRAGRGRMAVGRRDPRRRRVTQATVVIAVRREPAPALAEEREAWGNGARTTRAAGRAVSAGRARPATVELLKRMAAGSTTIAASNSSP